MGSLVIISGESDSALKPNYVVIIMKISFILPKLSGMTAVSDV